MKKKYFIGIIPPADIFEKIEGIKQELFTQHGLRGALRSPAHITLHRPFEFNEEKENVLIETLENFAYKKPFSIELKNFNCFQPRVIYVDVCKSESLSDLHYLLSGFMRRQLNILNEQEDMRGFVPHVTVAFRDLKKQKFYKLWDSYRTRQFSANFEFSGLCLLRLEQKWEIIKRFKV